MGDGLARTLMVQGTASGVGKSLLVAALCRLFAREGVRVAPFKAQNMALNAAVAPGGGEVGRAQAVQAAAAGVAVTVDMNPVLLKPEGAGRTQVVVLGRARGRIDAWPPDVVREELRAVIAGALERLRRRFDLVVIEGAGSPAEPNLQRTDLTNMYVARLAGAPVLLVGDIDRGGVFAHLVGTLVLLEPDDRARVAGLVVNRFRGDRALLAPALADLTARTGLPVLGVLPFVPDLRVAEEDGVALAGRPARPPPPAGVLDVVVPRLPLLSNQDDLDPLEAEPGVQVRLVEDPAAIAGADLVILPGSKGTARDLAWLRARGLATAIEARARAGAPVLGICGGCQMLGEEILDPGAVESDARRTPGLGLLPLRTRFAPEKVTANVEAVAAAPSFLAAEGVARGYEIHAGVVEATGPARAPAFTLVRREGVACHEPDGAVRGAVVGTLVHGLLANDPARHRLVAFLRARRGLPAAAPTTFDPGAEIERLADVAGAHLDWERVRRLALG